jgi:hypothetical protein
MSNEELPDEYIRKHGRAQWKAGEPPPWSDEKPATTIHEQVKMGPQLLNELLFAGVCFIAFTSIVTLAEELVEWRRHREAAPVQRQLLPPAVEVIAVDTSIGAEQRTAG